MSQLTNPLVSVVIPAYNAESFIKEAIDSVLNQTYQNVEVIVIDDGSSDSTLEILKQYENSSKVKILTHPDNDNLGVSKTRQLGVENSKGEYIAFLDADDIFLPNKLEIQVDAIQQNEEAILCHTGMKVKSELGDSPRISSIEKHFSMPSTPYLYSLSEQEYFLKQNRICNSTTLIKAKLLKEFSFASCQLFQYEDWLLWIMLSAKGKFLFLPQQLIQYR